MPRYKGPRDAARALLARGIRLDVDQSNVPDTSSDTAAGAEVRSGIGAPPGYIPKDGDAELLARMILSEPGSRMRRRFTRRWAGRRLTEFAAKDLKVGRT
mgnify:CR=1 FL=1